MRLPAGLAGTRGVVLDTMIFIYLFEDHPAYGRLCEDIVAAAADGRFHASVTPVTAAELLVKPLKAGRADVADEYRRALSAMPNVSLCSLTPQIGFLAGALRARYGLPLPDMLQVAAAMQATKPTLITNDKGLRRVGEIRVVLLQDFAT